MASALALSFLWAANRVAESVPFPPLALGERVVRLTPGSLATFFIEQLGHDAARLLSVIVVVAFLVAGALLPGVGPLAQAAPRVRAGLLFAAATLGAARADPIPHPLLPSLFVAVAAGVLYATALAWLDELAELQASAELDVSRRRALLSVGALAAGFVVGGSQFARFFGRLGGPNTDVTLGPPDERARIPRRPPFPEITGLSPELTSAADHYVVDIDLTDPAVNAEGWKLSVGGEVHSPLELDFSELQQRFALVEEYSVLTCVSNDVGGPLVGSSKWAGARLRDLLRAARPRAGAVEVAFRCADGYTSSLPLERAVDPSVIVAIAQNGRPLSRAHGFPCRLRAPAVYGMLNPKWLTEIRVVGADYRGYWARRGWSDTAIVRTESRIDTPGEAQLGEPTWVAGVAWGGIRGISRVEVSVDGGRSWRDARLHPPLSPLAWTQWAYRWTPGKRGPHRLQCRATDGQRSVQDAKRRPPHPSGASGYDEVDLVVS